MIPQIAFIDSSINSSYLVNEMDGTIDISGVFTVENNEVKTCAPVNDRLTHATLCSKIFCSRAKGKYSLYYINIFESDGQKTTIDNLIVALKWCMANKINIINLSIGSTSPKEIPILYDTICKIRSYGIVVVAACSNDGKMTFPASFHNVISVMAIENIKLEGGFSFKIDSIDSINAECYVNEEEILYNNLSYKIYSSNSFATPIITAQICNYMSRGILDIKEIISNLTKDAVYTSHREYTDTMIKKKYCNHVSIPIIAVVYEVNYENDTDIKMQLVVELLRKFCISGYEGICLSDTYITNIMDHIFNIENDNIYNLQEKLLFYSNYCNVSFLIVHIEKENFIKKINNSIFDIIVIDEKVAFYDKKYVNTEKVLVNKQMNSSTIFNKIYKLLLA